MKKIISAFLSMVIITATVITGVPVLTGFNASAAENDLDSASSILTAENSAPVESNSILWGDIYGMDDTPFLLSEKNELYLISSSSGHFNAYTFDNIKNTIKKQDENGAIIDTPSAASAAMTTQSLSVSSDAASRYRFLKGVAFDPVASGRKSYAAYVGAIKTGDGKYEMRCVVINAKTGAIKDITLGSADWINGYADNLTIMPNYMAITAGDYDGDHKDSVIVYLCGDSSSASDKNYKLFEVKFDGTNISKTEILDLSTVIKNNDIYGQTNCKFKPIVSLTSGDFDGDQLDEYAYSVGFDNTSSNARDGWSGKSVSTMDYFATAVGIGDYSNVWKHSAPARIYEKGARKSLSGTKEVYGYNVIQGGAVSGGDLDGDGTAEIVLVGYMSNDVEATFESGTMTSVSHIGDLNKSCYGTAVITFNENGYYVSDISTINHNEFTGTSVDKWKDDYFVYPQIAVECVATNGKNQAEDVFVSGSFYSYKDNSALPGFSPRLAGQHFDSILDDNTKTDCYFFGSAVAGNFDGNDVGREQIYYAAWFKNSGGHNYNVYIGLAGGSEYNDVKDSDGNYTDFGTVQTYACSNIRGDYGNYIDNNGSKVIKETKGGYVNVAPAAVDIDDDGVLARHNSTKYVYTDPEVAAVLQAAPVFGKIDEMGGYNGDSGTSYTLETSSGYSNTRGDTVSFGVGFSGELETGPAKLSLEIGYALDWDHEIEKAYGTTKSTTWNGADVDIVCITRTPVMLYLYDIWDADSGEWVEASHKVEAPLAPVKYSLSIPDYNNFVDEYNEAIGETALNKITVTDLPANTEGNPYSYFRNASQAGNGAEIISDSTYGLAYTGGSMTSELSTSAERTESTTFTHGFSFAFSAVFGGGVHGAQLFGGFYLNLDYGDVFGKSKTKGSAEGISGTVPNISEKALLADLTSEEIRQYYFNWELARWERELVVGERNIPFYGYFVHDITSPIDPPENLTATFTGTDEITGVKLEWDAPESIPNGPQLKGYFIFDNGEPVNSTMYTYSGTGKVTYTHNGVPYGSKHNYTVKAVSEIDSKRYTSVASNEASIGWVTTGNIIERIYKDETYTADELKDRYVIQMSDGSEFAFFVTNGKDGTNGTNGVDGKTAYEIAAANGYEGTQAEWLNQIGASCADAHTYKEYKISASCSHKGITVKVCELCGWATAEETEQLSHSYKKIKEIAPECHSKGYSVYKCEKCGDFYYDDETECTAHSFAEKTVKNTCCTEGYTVKYCTVCGYVESYDISAASGHDYTVRSVIAPTCLTKGFTVRRCSVCGDEIITDETAALSHDYESETHTATCTNPGFTSHKCQNCDCIYITGYTPALGHDYKKEVAAPTCSQKGYTTYTCQRDGCTESHIADITDTAAHSFKDKIVRNTCIAEGYTIHYCEHCGYQQIIDEKDAKGHSYELVQVIAPTCTTKGYSIYTCTDCGSTCISDETDFADHVSGEWICDDPALGHYSKKCEKCGLLLEEKTSVITAGGAESETAVKQGDVLDLAYNETLKLASGSAQQAKLTFVSSDPSVAVIDKDGVVTPVNGGTATITVIDNESGVSTSFTVNVRLTWWQRLHKILAGFVLFRLIFELLGVKYG